MNKEKPLSERISEYDAGDYFLTAAIWRPISYEFGDFHEIGIRHVATGKFWLLQNRYFDYQSVQDVAAAIATLLSDKTQCFTPEWCIEWFSRD